MIQASVSTSTGHLQIQAESYLDEPKIRTTLKDPQRILDQLSQVAGLKSFAPRAEGFALASTDSRSYGISVTAIDPVQEETVTSIKNLVKRGEYFKEDSFNAALIGAKLARNLGVDIGDEIVLLGQGYDGSVAAGFVEVSGIMESGNDEMDRTVAYVPLNWFQDTYSMGERVHRILIQGEELNRIKELQHQVRSVLKNVDNGNKRLVVLSWWEIVPGLLQMIQLDLFSGLIMYALLVFVVAFSILNTFLMAVFERTHEFGILLSLGTTHKRLTVLLFLESLLLTLCGILAGTALGIVLTLYVEGIGIRIPETEAIMRQFGLPDRIFPKLSFLTVTLGPLFVFIITALSALYPAIRVRKLSLVQALRAS